MAAQIDAGESHASLAPISSRRLRRVALAQLRLRRSNREIGPAGDPVEVGKIVNWRQMKNELETVFWCGYVRNAAVW